VTVCFGLLPFVMSRVSSSPAECQCTSLLCYV